MDRERLKRLQSIKIIISEAIMVLGVLLTVVILAFVVSGYWLNADFQVERQGMLQISSTPTGARINIDGEDLPWLSLTNTSKILSSGEHSVTLTKDGYDTWSKTINISEGLLYRLHYPRLFLKDRTIESVLDIDSPSDASLSPDRNKVIIAGNTTKWKLIELGMEAPKQTTIDISKLFSSVSIATEAEVGLFTGEIISAEWDSDSAHLLLQTEYNEITEWVVLDVNHPERSINLTREFGSDFERVEIIDRSSNTLLAVVNHNLHRIDLSALSISSVLVKNVTDFDYYNNKVVFSALLEDDGSSSETYYVGDFKVSDGKITELKRFSLPVKVAISKFYDETYITILHDNEVMVYPESTIDQGEVLRQVLSFSPDRMTVGHHGEFIELILDNLIATIDMESNTVKEWSVDSPNFGWLDDDILYSVTDSSLIIYDYDGLNRRELARGVSSHFPVAITDDRWLYYVSNDTLIREWLIEH